MAAITNLFRRIVATFRRSRLDDELREELQQHVAWKTDSLIAGGVPEGEARRRATVEVGNVTRLREQSRAVWGFPSFDSTAQNVRYAFRQIRRSPVVATVCIASLAVAIGAGSGVFALARAALYREAGVVHPEQVLMLRWEAPADASIFNSHQVDGSLPVFAMRTQDEQIARYLGRDRFFATLGTLLGAAAVLLACIGLYGLLSYAVTRRTAELGVRLALGASPGRLAASVIRESLLLAGAGAALGVPAAYAMGRAAEASLFGVSAASPLLLILASVVLGAVSAGAAFVPARRASRVDPLLVLRTE